MPFRTLLATVLVVAAAAAAPVAAQASPGLLLGIDDDALKWFSQTSSLLSIYDQLGVGAVRVTLDYTPGETFPTGTDRTELQRVGTASRRIRVVLAVTGQPGSPPLDDASRTAFCGFIANVVRRYPSIHDVAIWTEPNSGRFWQPQKGASAAYEALLATCWDTLHAVQPGMNVIATSAPHQKPGRWYAGLGAAYRSSHRILPIFDTVGHNAYPDTSGESPDKQHKNGSFDEGDLTRLLATLYKAFAGTQQPVPGQGGVTIWYLEDGFQAAPATDRALYRYRDRQARRLGDRAGDALDGGRAARVLPAGSGRLLQLRAARRDRPRGLAVGPAASGLDAQASVHRVLAGTCRSACGHDHMRAEVA